MEGVPGELWEAAKNAGPFGTLLMFYMWWRTDTERLRLQKERDGLLERVLSTASSLTETVREAIRLVRKEG